MNYLGFMPKDLFSWFVKTYLDVPSRFLLRCISRLHRAELSFTPREFYESDCSIHIEHGKYDNIHLFQLVNVIPKQALLLGMIRAAVEHKQWKIVNRWKEHWISNDKTFEVVLRFAPVADCIIYVHLKQTSCPEDMLIRFDRPDIYEALCFKVVKGGELDHKMSVHGSIKFAKKYMSSLQLFGSVYGLHYNSAVYAKQLGFEPIAHLHPARSQDWRKLVDLGYYIGKDLPIDCVYLTDGRYIREHKFTEHQWQFLANIALDRDSSDDLVREVISNLTLDNIHLANVKPEYYGFVLEMHRDWSSALRPSMYEILIYRMIYNDITEQWKAFVHPLIFDIDCFLMFMNTSKHSGSDRVMKVVQLAGFMIQNNPKDTEYLMEIIKSQIPLNEFKDLDHTFEDYKANYVHRRNIRLVMSEIDPTNYKLTF